MNEFQVLTYSGLLAFTAMTLIFLDFDDDNVGMMRPIMQRAYEY
tara:strand:- start:1838 stop:1969 length:132 start_codon:yes stop_codon:yes gene_type:complete